MGQEQKEAGCRVLVSACLLGERCRWHGGIHDSAAARKLIDGCPYFTACPEMPGGLPCPRPLAKRIHDRVYETCAEKSERKHVTGADITDAFELGAERTLAICLRYGIRKAILAKWSPSCDASGITGKLLRKTGLRLSMCFEVNILGLFFCHIAQKMRRKKIKKIDKLEYSRIMASARWV